MSKQGFILYNGDKPIETHFVSEYENIADAYIGAIYSIIGFIEESDDSVGVEQVSDEFIDGIKAGMYDEYDVYSFNDFAIHFKEAIQAS